MAVTGPYAVMAALAVYGGQQQRMAKQYESDVAGQNAHTARQQANAREEMVRRHNAQVLGHQRAAAVQSGFDPNSGSLLRIQGDSAAQAELDALTTRYEGGIQALNFQREAAGLHSQGQAAMTSGYLSAAGTLAGGYAKKQEVDREMAKYGAQRISPESQAPANNRFYGGGAYGD